MGAINLKANTGTGVVVPALTSAEKGGIRTSTGYGKAGSIAEVLGIADNAVETVMMTNFQNTGEGPYGVTQSWGSTFWNPVRELWYSTINTGTSAFLVFSSDGLNWSSPVFIGQNAVGAFATAAGCDEDGFVWVILSENGLVDPDASVHTIKKTNTNGAFWTDTAIDTSGFPDSKSPVEFTGPIVQIGSGEMACGAPSPTATTYCILFFFERADPTNTRIIDLADFSNPITYDSEITFCYDADNAALVGLARTDSSVITVKQVTLEAPWTTPVITSLDDEVIESVLLNGNQISVTCLGTNFVASATARSSGTEYLLVADRDDALSDPANAWALYHVGNTVDGVGITTHQVNGAGGLASNGTDTLIHLCGVGFGAYRDRDAESTCTRYQLAPASAFPIVRVSDSVRQRGKTRARRPIADNDEVTIGQSTAIGLSANCDYVCLGRALVYLPADAELGEKVWLEKAADEELHLIISTNVTGQEYTALWSKSGTTITATLPLHGRTNGETIKILTTSSEAAVQNNEVETVGGATTNTFTFTVTAGGTGGGGPTDTFSYRLYKTDTIHWIDGTTYTAGTEVEDDSDRRRTYVFTCLGPMEWLCESYQAEVTFLASTAAMTVEPTYDGNLMSRIDIMSGRNTFFIRDDFSGSGVASGAIGEIGWAFTEVGAGGSVDANDGVVRHPGVVKIITDTADASVAFLTNKNQDYWFARSGAPLHIEWIFRLPSVTSIYLFLGCENNNPTYGGGGGATTEPASCFGLKLDTGAASNPTQFKSVTRTGGTSTEGLLGVAVAGIDWYRIEITESPVGTMVFTLTTLAGSPYTSTTTTHTQNLTLDELYSVARVTTKANPGAKEIWLDFYSMCMWDLNR